MRSSPANRKRLIWPVLGGVALLLVLAGYVVNGERAGTGALLGLLGTAASILGTWAGIQFLGRLMQTGPANWQGIAVPIAFMVIKLPAILLAMSWALRLGPPAPSWFLAGLALVYSGLVWWAVASA